MGNEERSLLSAMERGKACALVLEWIAVEERILSRDEDKERGFMDFRDYGTQPLRGMAGTLGPNDN